MCCLTVASSSWQFCPREWFFQFPTRSVNSWFDSLRSSQRNCWKLFRMGFKATKIDHNIEKFHLKNGTTIFSRLISNPIWFLNFGWCSNHFKWALCKLLWKSTVPNLWTSLKLNYFPDCIVLVLLFEGFSWELIKLNENLRLQCHVNWQVRSFFHAAGHLTECRLEL